jgi:predicted ester cyclase
VYSNKELVRRYYERVVSEHRLEERLSRWVAEGDLVATRVTAGATHTGVWQAIAPTGSEIRLDGINIDRVEAGLIAEHWGQADTVGMLYQMGVDPFAGRHP